MLFPEQGKWILNSEKIELTYAVSYFWDSIEYNKLFAVVTLSVLNFISDLSGGSLGIRTYLWVPDT